MCVLLTEKYSVGKRYHDFMLLLMVFLYSNICYSLLLNVTLKMASPHYKGIFWKLCFMHVYTLTFKLSTPPPTWYEQHSFYLMSYIWLWKVVRLTLFNAFIFCFTPCRCWPIFPLKSGFPCWPMFPIETTDFSHGRFLILITESFPWILLKWWWIFFLMDLACWWYICFLIRIPYW